MRGGKKRKKRSATEYQTGNLKIARHAPYLLHYILRHYNKHLVIYVTYKAACTSSLIQTYIQTDTGCDIVASAMKQIATKILRSMPPWPPRNLHLQAFPPKG